MKGRKINNRLLCELSTNKDFQRFMVVMEICAGRMPVCKYIVLAATRKQIVEKYDPDENDLHLRTLELVQINEDEYFNRVVHDDLDRTIRDIQETHKKDSTTADEVNPADKIKQELEDAMCYEGSNEERQARVFCKNLGINCAKLSREKFVSLINVLKRPSYMKGKPNKRGKCSPPMTHGKGRQKRK